MKRNIFTEKYSEPFFEYINHYDFTPKKQIVKFVSWCVNNGFLDNLPEEKLTEILDDRDDKNGICLPFLKHKGITIGIDYRESFCRVGIDPSNCFNKTGQCSIVYRFPITSKREEKKFYKTLETLLDKKTETSKEWFKNAGTQWCGEYMTNEK